MLLLAPERDYLLCTDYFSPRLAVEKSTGSGGRQTWMKQPWATIKSYLMSVSLGFLILKLGVKIVHTLRSKEDLIKNSIENFPLL